DAVRTLFKGNCDALDNGEGQRFMTGMQSGLMNHSKRNDIPDYLKAKESLYRVLAPDLLNDGPEVGLARLSRYLGRDDLPDGMKIPCLLIAGEYDPFTSVHDHFLVARRCDQAQL